VPVTKWTFFVRGDAVAQGSTRAFVMKGRPVITSTAKGLKAWRELVAYAAQGVATPECPVRGPVRVVLHFYVPRPKSLPKKTRTWPVTRPDCDKLARSVLDAVTMVIIHDDSQVVRLEVAKRYAHDPFTPAQDQPPGVFVEIAMEGEAPHIESGRPKG
jgi:crossover junction endodeoxyribonuclease RusA